MRVASTEETAQGASCNDVSPYCLWNETCVNGRCESLCLGTECSQPNHECHVHREEGAEKGVPKCVEKGAEMPSTCHGVCRERGYWKDEECDLECYSYACEFDGGDCDPGLYCNDLSPYCLWNETCVNHDGTSFGRCESLCLDHECPQDHDCQVHREEGAEKGVPQCVEKDPSVTTQPPPTPASPTPMLTAEQEAVLTDWIGQGTSLQLLYTGTSEAWSYDDFVDKVVDGAGGLVLVIWKDRYTFGCFLDCGLRLPAEHPVEQDYIAFDCPMCFFSLEGHFDAPTRMPIGDVNMQGVSVSRRGSARAPLWWGVAHLVISYMQYLSIGWTPDNDTDSSVGLDSMMQFIKAPDVPDGYSGVRGYNNSALLAGHDTYKADEMLVLRVT